MKYAKGIAAVIATGLAGLVAAMTDNHVDVTEWINIAILLAGAANIFAAPNVPGSKYTKSVLAVITAVLVLAVSLVSNGLTLSEVLQLVLAGAGAVGVYGLPNRGDTLDQMTAGKP